MSGDLDFEPVRGLPGDLPAGETLLWQGAPDFRVMAVRGFHVRKVGLYFALLALWRLEIVVRAGMAPLDAARSVGILVGLGLAAMAILGTMAYLVCRTTVYSITSRRVVMRIGVALPITFNIPFMVIGAGALKGFERGTGSIPLSLTGKNRLSYLVIWPHARPWRFARAEPTIRFVPDAARVAAILSQAVCACLPETMQPATVEPVVAVPGQSTAWPPLAPAAA